VKVKGKNGMRQSNTLSLSILVGTIVYAEIALVTAGAAELVYPGKGWETKRPQEIGLDEQKLKAFSDYAGGFGCVVRNGYMVYTWGDASKRNDVASAVKPVYTHFLLKAVEEKRLAGIDDRVARFEPGLNSLNEALGYKDRKITWRHLCNQISCYGVRDRPGDAFDYSDYNMALFFDNLMLKVYGVTYQTVDAEVLHPKLTDALGCQDNPTFMAFGTENRPGRLAISPRDFARFGLLYLRKGKWQDKQLISPQYVKLATTSPLPQAVGMENTSLLVSSSGRVIEVEDTWFTIEDGSMLKETPSRRGLLVRCGTLPKPAMDDYVTATGIACVELDDLSPIRAVRIRTAADVQSVFE
jgi:CubicO group peptidase (beta-lactamase class C family)